MNKFNNIIVVFISFVSYASSLNDHLTGLERLIHQIFVVRKYNDLVRPVDRENGLTNIQTELKLLQIDLDEKYQKLISTAWFEMIWNDSRISWDPTQFDDITEITLPVSKIWTPDIVLQNGVGENDYLTEFKYFNPWISHTGSVTWVPEVRLHTKCSIKVKDFPFDKQCCEISFYSWAHTAKQMSIKQVDDKRTTNISHISDNIEWKIYHTCASNHTIRTGENLDWWVTTYVIFIERNSLYHVYTLLMPCTVLSILSCLLFLLPPDSGEKISLGVTIMLAFFVNTLVVANYTPEATAEIPVIGVYYTFNIIFVAFSLAASIFVLRVHFRGHKSRILYDSVKNLLKIDSIVKKGLLKHNDHVSILENIKISDKDSEKEKQLQEMDSKINFKRASQCYDDKHILNLVRILKSIHNAVRFQRKERKDLLMKENILTEWKEFARKLDLFMFFISVFVVATTPMALFSQYVVFDKNQPMPECKTDSH